MQNKTPVVVVLGTGGTIAGTASSASDNVGYTAAQLGAADLVTAIPALSAFNLEVEQVAQLDSKDMSFNVWRDLALRCAHHVARSEVAGIVITHGTDTLEETAYFLNRVLHANKPVVLTAAMRPATSAQADGPQNLLDSVALVLTSGAHGVMAVLAGTVHGAVDVRKVHTYQLDAFTSGDSGALARVEEGVLRQLRAWPASDAICAADQLISLLPTDESAWPQVHIVSSHAGATALPVQALVAAGVRGMVVSATGNGTLHHVVEAALIQAQSAGVKVLRATRCNDGPVVGRSASPIPVLPRLNAVKARIELMLQLMRAEGHFN
jgi:L-asparaginase